MILTPQVVEKPARKLVLKRGRNASDYFAYCEEVGCDAWDLLAAIPGALGEPMGVWLPPALRRPETSEYAMAVEMPGDHAGPLPETVEALDLPPATYLVFSGPPFAERDLGEAVAGAWRAIEAFDPGTLGFEWAPERAPRYQLAPTPERGTEDGLPVRRVRAIG